MKYFLLFFYILIFLSCDQPDKKSKESNLINNLNVDTWVSKQYKDTLYQSNSVFNAENSISNDEDLVFQFFSQKASEFYASTKAPSGTLVSGYNPYWMEEHFYILKKDSTVVERDGKQLFKISEVINDTLILNFKNNKKRTFIRSNTDNIYQSLGFINREWFAGDYLLTYKSKTVNIIFNKDGTIDNKSEILNSYKKYNIYVCKGNVCKENLDLLVISEDDTNLKTVSFIIEKRTKGDEETVLSEIDNIEDEDSPIRRNGNKMTLKKVAKTIQSK